MVEEKTWEEFRSTGLLLYINQILHIFGWAVVAEYDEDKNFKRMYPARVKFRGFDSKSVANSYIKISKYLKENINVLEKEARE